MFGLFKKNKQNNTMETLIANVVMRNNVLDAIAKIQSFRDLSRHDEAMQIFMEYERKINHYSKSNQNNKEPHVMLVMLYQSVGNNSKAMESLNKLLEYNLEEDEKLVVMGELQKIQREIPKDEKSSSAAKNFTQVYCCLNCGRLHNYVSMPCPHCDWSPNNIHEISQATILSNLHMSISSLLTLSREMEKGREAHDVVKNLIEGANSRLNIPEIRRDLEKIYNLLRENEHKNHKNIENLRLCEDCGTKVIACNATECHQCGEQVNWPDMLRLLIAIDNILYLFESRMEIDNNAQKEEFISVLISINNELLRKQTMPSDQTRKYALTLFRSMSPIFDLNRGACIDNTDVNRLKIYMIKDSMRDDTEAYVKFWFNELQFFLEKMSRGIR